MRITAPDGRDETDDSENRAGLATFHERSDPVDAAHRNVLCSHGGPSCPREQLSKPADTKWRTKRIGLVVCSTTNQEGRHTAVLHWRSVRTSCGKRFPSPAS